MFPEERAAIGKVAVWLALVMLVLGSIITFVPGAEADWYWMAVVPAAVGLLSPRWRVRLGAVVLATALVWQARLCEEHGRAHREFLQRNGLIPRPEATEGDR